MTIDLMDLAKRADEAYIDVQTSFGPLRVYHVPDVAILSIGPDEPEPEMPTIRMKTATGFQERPAKPTDPEYDEWKKEQAAWNEYSFELHRANNMIYALRDAIDWEKYDISEPPPVAAAQEMYNGCWPEHDLLRKKAWIDWTLLFKRSDGDAIATAVNKLRGEAEPTDEMVEAVKKNSD